MKEWQNKSDFEINKAVAELECLSLDNGYGFVDTDENLVCYHVVDSSDSEPYAVEVRVNYCNNWSDGGSIISENKIGLQYDYSRSRWDAMNHKVCNGGFSDKNPLRAAMIVYLEMKGVKP